MEMREKVQSQGAFSARAHERSAETAGTRNVLKVSSCIAPNNSSNKCGKMSCIKITTRKFSVTCSWNDATNYQLCSS